MFDLFYHRPKVTKIKPTSDRHERIQRISTYRPPGVPAKLSFENIINGQTCYPCRLRDFMFYLQFIEKSDENLKFFLWYKAYVRRFDQLPHNERKKSPTWIDDVAGLKLNAEGYSEEDQRRFTISNSERTSATIEAVLVQPFRSEISLIIALFLYPGSPLELNLSSRDRALTLRALRRTTHPSALLPAVASADLFLRLQSHPNFIRRAVCNANDERGSVLTYVYIYFFLQAVVSATLLILSNKGKGWRVFSAASAALGVVAWTCQRRHFCLGFFLRGLRRSTEPWDDFETSGAVVDCYSGGCDDGECGVPMSWIPAGFALDRWTNSRQPNRPSDELNFKTDTIELVQICSRSVFDDETENIDSHAEGNNRARLSIIEVVDIDTFSSDTGAVKRAKENVESFEKISPWKKKWRMVQRLGKGLLSGFRLICFFQALCLFLVSCTVFVTVLVPIPAAGRI